MNNAASQNVGIIYCAFDKQTFMCYVGQSWDTLEQRQKSHRKGRLHFDKVFRKRPNDFLWSVIINNICNQRELDDAEIYWGNELQSLWPSGYNHRLGYGRGVVSEEARKNMSIAARKRARISEDTRAKMSAASAKRRHTERTKQKMSESASRVCTPELREFRSQMAKSRSPELRAKMAEAVKRSWIKRKVRNENR